MNSKLISYYQKKAVSWEGWIESGVKKHKMTVGDLKIDLEGRVSGEGVDFVGKYFIKGAAGPRLHELAEEAFHQEIFLKTESSESSKKSKDILQSITGWTGDRVYFRKIYDETRAIEYSGRMIANQLKGSWSLVGNPTQQGTFCIYMTAKEWTLSMYAPGSSITHPSAISTICFISADDHGLVSIGSDREAGIYLQVGVFESLQMDSSICKQYIGTDQINFFSGKFTSGQHQYHIRGSVQFPNFTISHFELKGLKVKEEYYPTLEGAEHETADSRKEPESTHSRHSSKQEITKETDHSNHLTTGKSNPAGSDRTKHLEVRVPHASSMDSQLNRASSHQSSAARAGPNSIHSAKQPAEQTHPYEMPVKVHSDRINGFDRIAEGPRVYQVNHRDVQQSSMELQSEINGYAARSDEATQNSKPPSSGRFKDIKSTLQTVGQPEHLSSMKAKFDMHYDQPVNQLKRSGYLSSSADWELFTDFELTHPDSTNGSPDEDIVSKLLSEHPIPNILINTYCPDQTHNEDLRSCQQTDEPTAGNHVHKELALEGFNSLLSEEYVTVLHRVRYSFADDTIGGAGIAVIDPNSPRTYERATAVSEFFG